MINEDHDDDGDDDDDDDENEDEDVSANDKPEWSCMVGIAENTDA